MKQHNVLAYLRETGRCLWRHVSWIERPIVTDGPEEIVIIVALKRRLADEHLVEKDTQRPEVDRCIVLLALDDLLANSQSNIHVD